MEIEADISAMIMSAIKKVVVADRESCGLLEFMYMLCFSLNRTQQ